MTLEELHNRIGVLLKTSPRNKDNEVCVVDKNKVGMGGHSTHKITGINNGFDWDRGKSFIQIEGFEKGI